MSLSAIHFKVKQKTLESTEIVVGKDILELLANAMYVDPLTIYREYIQNAADSIDEACIAGVAVDAPRIDIRLDHAARTVKIRDNGAGIPNSDFVRRITAIGSSHKRGANLRGFRGVGRLSGLGYCQELMFRGKAAGDARVIEVTWNGRALREKIRDSGYQGDLSDIITEVVTYSETPANDKAESFFEVEMRKVGRLRNDLLLNEQLIRAYISQVAPVPFDPALKFSQDLQSFLTKHDVRPPIHIELNDDAGPVYHRVRDQIEFNPKVTDTLRDIEQIEIRDDEGQVAAFGWIAHHSYLGAVPKRLGFGGIRMRAGNIQVGDESVLAPLYPEQRFAAWVIGDVHVCSKKIVPNARRDDFEHNTHYTWLQSELGMRANRLAHLIRSSSQQRQHLRTVQISFQAIDDWVDLAKSQSTPLLLKKALLDLSNDHVQVAEKEVSKLAQSSEDHCLSVGRLGKVNKEIQTLNAKVEAQTDVARPGFSRATERALIKALKVVLSNARSAKVGTKTAMDIVAAVNGPH